MSDNEAILKSRLWKIPYEIQKTIVRAIEVRKAAVGARAQLIAPYIAGVQATASIERAVRVCSAARAGGVVDRPRKCVGGRELEPAVELPFQNCLQRNDRWIALSIHSS